MVLAMMMLSKMMTRMLIVRAVKKNTGDDNGESSSDAAVPGDEGDAVPVSQPRFSSGSGATPSHPSLTG